MLFDVVFWFFIVDLRSLIENKFLFVLVKWGVFLISFVIIYLIIKHKEKIKKIQKLEEKEVFKFNDFQKEILEKENLKSKADYIIEKYQRR